MYRFNPELKRKAKKSLHSGLQRTYRQLQRIPAERSSLQLSAENLPEIAEELFEQTEATAKEDWKATKAGSGLIF